MQPTPLNELTRVFGEALLVGRSKEVQDDSILVVDKQTGCHLRGDNLVHTEECICDEKDHQKDQDRIRRPRK